MMQTKPNKTQECEGHPAGPFDPMGETVFCDGTCGLSARVEMMNDSGDTASEVSVGATYDDAVWHAVMTLQDATGDDSWAMNDWRAA